MNTHSLEWEQRRTYFFDGHCVISNLKKLPLIYRFELNGSFTEKTNYKIKLYFPLSEEHYPVNDKIEKLSILIDRNDGISLDLYDLEPVTDLCDINCSDTVLCFQTFNITGIVVLNIRNRKENIQIVL